MLDIQKHTRKDMVEAIVDDVGDWDTECLIAYAKDQRQKSLENLKDEELLAICQNELLWEYDEEEDE